MIFESNNVEIAKELVPDYFTPVSKELSDVFSRYRVLFMAGNLDILIPVASVSRAVNNIPWKCQDDLKRQTRRSDSGLWMTRRSLDI